MHLVLNLWGSSEASRDPEGWVSADFSLPIRFQTVDRNPVLGQFGLTCNGSNYHSTLSWTPGVTFRNVSVSVSWTAGRHNSSEGHTYWQWLLQGWPRPWTHPREDLRWHLPAPASSAQVALRPSPPPPPCGSGLDYDWPASEGGSTSACFRTHAPTRANTNMQINVINLKYASSFFFLRNAYKPSHDTVSSWKSANGLRCDSDELTGVCQRESITSSSSH